MSLLNVLFRVFAAIIIFFAYMVLLFLGYGFGIEVLLGALAALLIGDYFYTVLVFRSYFKILYDTCDVIKYTNKLRLRIKNDVSVGFRYKNMLRVYLVLGLYYGGFFEEAKRILEEVAINPRMNHNIKLLYNQLCFLIAVQDRNFEAAEKRLKEFETLISKYKNRKSYMTKLQNNITYFHFILRLKQGDYTNAEEILNRRLLTADRKLLRVSVSIHLADVYLHKSDEEKAVTFLEYAVQNGNSLYVASLAKCMLQELGRA